MNEITQKDKKTIFNIIVGLAILLGLFLLAATLVKAKEYRFVGSGVNATNTITVSGKGKVDRAPDTAKISFTISDTQKAVKTAQENVSKKVEAITAELKSAGIEEKYIKTESYNSYPQYDYSAAACRAIGCPRPGMPILMGYQVSHFVTVSIKNVENVDSVLDILGKNNASDISGPNFGFEDDKAIAREARDIAIEDAKMEAQKLAKSLGVNLVRIVSFNEQGGVYPTYGSAAMNQSKDAMQETSLSIPVGDKNVETTVTLVYEIQ